MTEDEKAGYQGDIKPSGDDGQYVGPDEKTEKEFWVKYYNEKTKAWEPCDGPDILPIPVWEKDWKQTGNKYCPIINRLCLREMCVAFTLTEGKPYCVRLEVELPILNKDEPNEKERQQAIKPE